MFLGIVEERPKKKAGGGNNDVEEEFRRIGMTGEEGEEDFEHQFPDNGGIQCGCQCVVM